MLTLVFISRSAVMYVSVKFKECCFVSCIMKAFTGHLVSVGKIQHRSVRLPGAAESVSVAGGGISSSEAGIPSSELARIYCQ